jgi:6-phosphogluconolactonase (cycloisomerase 2 family)
MKWNGTGRGLKALGVSLALALGMTACSRDYVVGYLYVTSAKSTPGLVNAYAIDYQSGSLTQLADSPIPSGGNNPVTLVASPNAQCIYVLNHDTSTVVQFNIGTDGKLYAANTYNVVQGNGLIGTFPTSAAIDSSGKFLYITFTYQNGFTTVKPGPGGVAIFPINADNSLGAPLATTIGGVTTPYVPVGNNPVGITTSLIGSYVYVIDDEQPASGAPFGVLLAFKENTSTGALTAIPGPVSNGFAAGVTPSSIAEDPSGQFIYITDSSTNLVIGYLATVGTGSSPVAMTSSPFSAGLFPVSVKVDPRGLFVYVANYTASTVNTYAINIATGSLSGSGPTTVSTGPTCVTIDPALGIYLYTSNAIDNSVSAEQLNPHTGALTAVQGTQFPAAALPTCAVAVANGAHATQIVQ